MNANNGIECGNTILRRKKFDLFRPVSVKADGRRIESANWCVRFQYKGKRTCRSLGTADYRLATQRAKQLVTSVRQHGWAGAFAHKPGQPFHYSAVGAVPSQCSFARASAQVNRTCTSGP
jgi:hypothetical protein